MLSLSRLSIPRGPLEVLYSPDNSVKNPGFEEGPHRLINSTNGVLIPPRQQDLASPLPGWMIESLKAVKFIDKMHFNVPFGQAATKLVGGRESAIAQIIRTDVSKCYNLSLTIGDARNAYHGNMMVEAFAAKDAQGPIRITGEGRVQDCQLQVQSTFCKNKGRILQFLYHTRKDDSGSP